MVSNDNRRHQKERGTNLKGCGESARKWQGDFPGGPVVKNPSCTAGHVGLIPVQGTRILHAIEQLSLRAASTEATSHN